MDHGPSELGGILARGTAVDARLVPDSKPFPRFFATCSAGSRLLSINFDCPARNDVQSELTQQQLWIWDQEDMAQLGKDAWDALKFFHGAPRFVCVPVARAERHYNLKDLFIAILLY